MILEDTSLREALQDGTLKIEPLWPHAIQPNSVDLHLGQTLRRPRIDPGVLARGYPMPLSAISDELMRLESYPHGEQIVLKPGEFALGATAEAVELGAGLMGWATGASSVARAGLNIVMAGLVDSGFHGTLTLELVNMSPFPLLLDPGERIGQLVVARLVRPSARPYGSPGLGSRYQGQIAATAAMRYQPQWEPKTESVP